MTRSPSIKTEALAGITTFFTVAYILVVNPAILSTQGTGMAFSGVMTATVALCFLMTLFMGLYAKLPFAVAPGMGINAFFTYTLILGKGIPWPTALGMVFWAGVFFLILSVLPVRRQIAEAIPLHLRHASAAGIGIFLTFIGLKNIGLVSANPATLVQLGKVDAKIMVSLLGLIPAFLLIRRKSPFAFLATILVVTLVFVATGWVAPPAQWIAMPDFGSVLFKLDIWGALKPALLPAILSLMFTDLFDSISTFVGVSQATGLVDEQGQPRNLSQGLVVDAVATLGAGLLGTSSGTAFIESAAGIEAGGRTGLTSVITALCFLPALFVAPLAAMVPAHATAPILILVGSLMFKGVTEMKMSRPEETFPAFLTMILIPLTFSITQGILWGFVAHGLLFLLVGRWREVSPTMRALSAISLLMLWLEQSG